MRIFFVIVVLLLSGCATSGIERSPAPETTSAVHQKCTYTEQVGCIEIDVLNLQWDGTHPFMKGLLQPPQNEDMRYSRVTTLGPRFYTEYKDGRVKAGPPKSYLFYLFRSKEVPIGHIGAYRLNGRTLTSVRPEMVTGSVPIPVFDPVTPLGKPVAVYRVRAEGDTPAGVALQLPWSVITEETYLLVCAEDRNTIYPNTLTRDEGLWITPEYFASMRSRGWEYVVLQPFLLQ